MPRYIDADRLISRLNVFNEWCKDGRLQGSIFAADVIGDEPTADVEPVRHGHWIHGVCGIDKYIKCSFCGKSIVNNIVTLEGDDAETAFVICPRCGAKMDKKEK